MRVTKSLFVLVAVVMVVAAQAGAAPPPQAVSGRGGGPVAPAAQTTAYQPKFAGDKAHSDAEAAALGYMRTVVAAQRAYRRKHGHYADSLRGLVGSQSFTRRMANPNRGDYKVGFHARPQGYSLTLTPNQFDPAHRAFYVDETGEFRVEESRAATASSETLN